MHRPPLRLLIACFVLLLPLSSRANNTPHRTVHLAITIDDLPGGGPEIGEFTHVRIVNDIIAALRAHHVGSATGFVVGSMLEGRPERQPALDAWVHAGFQVGNHTYSHRSLDDIGLAGYMADIAKNRPLVDALEKQTGQSRHYFRYPFLEEGRTPSERHALAHFLSMQGYLPARVSVDFSDWAWADAYARCIDRGDSDALPLLQQSYLDNGMAYLIWSIAAGHEAVGHAVPQVLLLHANVATAINLDALLTAYERVGVRYIPLATALDEPLYTAVYDSSGGNVLAQASKRMQRGHPPYLVRPLPLLDLVCREPPLRLDANTGH